MTFCSKTTALLLTAILLAACTIDNYESGDGNYSYLRADFAMAQANSEAKLVWIETDGGEKLTLVPPTSVNGVKADTLLRALVYYDLMENHSARLRGMSPVVMLTLRSDVKDNVKRDPVHWESIWLSENGKYVNLSLKLMVGRGNGESDSRTQALAMLLERSEPIESANQENAHQPQRHYLTLAHAQNNVPQYYSYQAYVSIPVEGNFQKGDELTVSINTYDGVKEKTIVVR